MSPNTHATPLGCAPSPSVFLAAVAQRTRRLRFGPLVYTLPLYHPLRLIDEICMLDQMSGGRWELGVGRGISPFELGYFGIDPATAQAMYIEALEVIVVVGDAGAELQGKYYNFRNVPIELEPVQKPHPPLWYGIGKPRQRALGGTQRRQRRRQRAGAVDARHHGPLPREWTALGHTPETIRKWGVTRHVVVAETEREALEIARPAYQKMAGKLHAPVLKHGSGWPTRTPCRRRSSKRPSAWPRRRRYRGQGAGVPAPSNRRRRPELPVVAGSSSATVQRDAALPAVRLFARKVMPFRLGARNARSAVDKPRDRPAHRSSRSIHGQRADPAPPHIRAPFALAMPRPPIPCIACAKSAWRQVRLHREYHAGRGSRSISSGRIIEDDDNNFAGARQRLRARPKHRQPRRR